MERTEAQQERDLWLLVIGASVADPVRAATLLGKELKGCPVPSEFVDLISVLSLKEINRKAVRFQFAKLTGITPQKHEGMIDAVADTIRDKVRMRKCRDLIGALGGSTRVLGADEFKECFEKLVTEIRDVWK